MNGVVIMLVLVVCIAIVALAYLLANTTEECPDSHDGHHEYAHTRSETGWQLTCVICGRMTGGIAAFPRKVD